MKLICRLITKYFSDVAQTGESPAWVSRHIAHCARCAAHIEAQRLMQQHIVHALALDDPCPVPWDAIAARIAAQQRSHALTVRRPVLAAAAITALAAITLVVLFGPGLLRHKPVAAPVVAERPTPVVKEIQVAPAPATVTVSDQPRVTVSPRRRVPRQSVRRTLSVVTNNGTSVAPEIVEGREQVAALPATEQSGPIDRPTQEMIDNAGSMAADVLIGLSGQMTDEKSAEIQHTLLHLLVSVLPG
jgi:hypothetical protein